MAKIIDTDGLAFFKDQQDAANEKKFVKSADFVDSNGVILADKLPVNFGADVVAIHVVTLNNKTKFYNDRVDGSGNHVTCPNEVQGEVGKIYIDLYQQTPPKGYPQAPQQQMPPIQTVTEDMIKNFEDAITYGAKQLSGFSDEQVDEPDYFDRFEKRTQIRTDSRRVTSKLRDGRGKFNFGT